MLFTSAFVALQTLGRVPVDLLVHLGITPQGASRAGGIASVPVAPKRRSRVRSRSFIVAAASGSGSGMVLLQPFAIGRQVRATEPEAMTARTE